MLSKTFSGHLTAVLSLFANSISARNVPQNVRDLYNNLRSGSGCSNKLATGFISRSGGSNGFSYCGDRLSSDGIIYIKGPGSALANMDIDCDGAQGGSTDDGRCGSSLDTQSVTSFQWILQGYGKGIRDLNANVHPYVVFGNVGSKKGWRTFEPQQYGIQPLSLMAVVCGDKLVYGIWGDMNGDDGDESVVGEASISLATACFGNGVNGNAGHDVDDVLYIAFTGAQAVPGSGGADWSARNYNDFQKSIEKLGDSLVSKIGGGNPPGSHPPGPTPPGPTPPGPTPTRSSPPGHGPTGRPGRPGGHPGNGGSGGSGKGGGGGNHEDQDCEWPGHCAGSSCWSHDDCSGVLTCTNNVCVEA